MTATASPTAPAAARGCSAIVVYTLQSCLPPRRWAAVLAAVRRRRCCSGCSPTPSTPTAERAFANVAAEGILGLVVPIAALVIGDAVLGAEVRGGTFQFTWLSPAPTWQIVLGRWLGGSLVAARHDRPGVRARRGRRRRARRASGRSSVAAAVGSVVLRRRVHRHRLPHPAHRGVVAGVRVPRRAAARRGADRHRPALADVGVAGDVRRAARRPAAAASSARGSRRAAAPIVRLLIVAGRRPGDRRPGGCATCACPAPPTDAAPSRVELQP